MSSNTYGRFVRFASTDDDTTTDDDSFEIRGYLAETEARHMRRGTALRGTVLA
jgi:hypothetical protein